jgi:hypothetical protein
MNRAAAEACEASVSSDRWRHSTASREPRPVAPEEAARWGTAGQAATRARFARDPAKASPANPASIIAQVDGSGTALTPLLKVTV